MKLDWNIFIVFFFILIIIFSSSAPPLPYSLSSSSSVVEMDDKVKATDRAFEATVSKEEKEKASLNEEGRKSY